MEGDNFTFPCSRCRYQFTLPTTFSRMCVTCPKCGMVNRVPQIRYDVSRKWQVIRVVLLVVILIVTAWWVTLTFGIEAVRPDIADTVGALTAGRQTELSIRVPLPFVVTFRVKGTHIKDGMRVGFVITKYYFWWFYKRVEIPRDKVPGAFSWIWRFKTSGG